MMRIASAFAALLLSATASAQSTPESTIVPSSLGPLRVTTVASGLQNPWGIAFLPDGRALITERPGRLRLLTNGVLSPALTGVPAVWAQGQGGLLDVVLDPDFASNQRIYLTFAEVGGDGRAVVGEHGDVDLTADALGRVDDLGDTAVQLAVGVLADDENLAHGNAPESGKTLRSGPWP